MNNSEPFSGTWNEIEYGGLQLLAETGVEWREAKVIQGGNGLWTAYVNQGKRGKIRANGKRYAGKGAILEMMRPQTETKDEAKIWAEEMWMRMPDLAA